MRRQRGPLCNDDAADCVGPSVLAPQVPPPGTYPPPPPLAPPQSEEVRAHALRPEALGCKVLGGSSEIQGSLWCEEPCLEQLRVLLPVVWGYILSPNTPFIPLPWDVIYFFIFLVGRGWSGRIATFFLALHKIIKSKPSLITVYTVLTFLNFI